MVSFLFVLFKCCLSSLSGSWMRLCSSRTLRKKKKTGHVDGMEKGPTHLLSHRRNVLLEHLFFTTKVGGVGDEDYRRTKQGLQFIGFIYEYFTTTF